MALRVGIIAPQSSAQSYSLKTAITELGYEIVCFNPHLERRAVGKTLPEVEAWVVVGEGEAVNQLSFIDRKKHQVLCIREDVPTLVSPSFGPWKERLRGRLVELVGKHLQSTLVVRAKKVWVLAASTGGLEMVSKFLSQVPLAYDTGFVYVQHIESAQVPQLVRMIARTSQWRARLAENGHFIPAGFVTVVSPAEKLHIDNRGMMRVLDERWNGHYRPSIDHVAGDVARQYGVFGGMIVFTGMGDDGVIGARLLRRRGGRVWVQDPGTCMAPSMPEAVIGAQASQFTAGVDELARRFASTAGFDVASQPLGQSA